MNKTLFPLILCLLLLSGCFTPESLENFDSKAWKNDRKGCNGERVKLIGEFEALRKEFYGKKEFIVRRVLGKPDQEELLERNQRIYYYYIEPGVQCAGNNNLPEANRVEVRFNALAKVSEITYQEPLKSRKPE
jgi:hypothetical protein